MEQQALCDELIIQQVLRIRSTQKRIGARKLLYMLTPFMEQHHLQVGRDAFFDLLGKHHLLIRRKRRKVPRTTFSDHWYRKHPNLIVGMDIISPNTVWVSDITYITLEGDFAYLSLITDAYSRMIVGYHLDKTLQTAGCVKALKKALKRLPKGSSPIHHSDRGCQYCSTEYVEQLQARQIAISMTQNSDPRENAIAERVNGIIKQEFLQASYQNFSEAAKEVATAIDIYNQERPHSSIDMLTPQQAHTQTGKLKQHWKNYYNTQRKEVAMT
jgi:transposase InsO family protein